MKFKAKNIHTTETKSVSLKYTKTYPSFEMGDYMINFLQGSKGQIAAEVFHEKRCDSVVYLANNYSDLEKYIYRVYA